MSRTVFITGTNSGFGKATVERFATAGWNVAATVRSAHMNDSLFRALPRVSLYELDVTDFAQVDDVAQRVIKQFGKVDVVVNNAGYCLMGPTETTTMEQIKHQYETNVFGLFAVTKAFIGHFRDHADGMFINVASASAQFNYPYIAAYGSSKWAVRGITESLGIELAPFNIEVKAVYPGAHATQIFTKLDDGATRFPDVYRHYKRQYLTFLSAQKALPSVTAPTNIANEIYRAATDRKGPLHIISGGDAKFYRLLKRIMSERVFQRIQIRAIMQPLSGLEVSFAKWLMGSNVATLAATPKTD